MEQALFSIARQAYRDPREAAVRLLSLGVPQAAIWPAFGAIVLVSVLLSGLSDLVAPPPEEIAVSYFALTVILGVVFLSFAVAVWKIGQLMGGKGGFEESLTVGIFFQVILLPFQVLQLVLAIVSPALGTLYAVGLLIFGIWINVNFVDALHGFASFMKALVVLILSSFAAAVAMLLTISIFGFSIGAPV